MDETTGGCSRACALGGSPQCHWGSDGGVSEVTCGGIEVSQPHPTTASSGWLFLVVIIQCTSFSRGPSLSTCFPPILLGFPARTAVDTSCCYPLALLLPSLTHCGLLKQRWPHSEKWGLREQWVLVAPSLYGHQYLPVFQKSCMPFPFLFTSHMGLH